MRHDRHPRPGNPAAGDEDRPIGYGRIQRKEDPRFVRGKGHYLDDIVLPGMLHGAILRAPVAHARLVSIDTTEALAHPKVMAVITGKDLEGLNLAWAPTLSADVQAVLATDKVRFQGQEVAFVVAEDRYAARDALELIDVEYDVLPPSSTPGTRSTPDAPVIRDDMEGRTDNHIFDWEAGDKAETDAVFAARRRRRQPGDGLPAGAPGPDGDLRRDRRLRPVDGKLTLYETTQAPHAHRTLFAMVAGIPEHKIRVVSPDIGGGFGNKVGIYPGYILAVVGSIVTGKPVKWVEDRSENLMSTSFARDYIMQGEIAATKDGKILAVRTNVLADHGAFNATAQPTKYPAGFFSIFTGSYDLQAAHCTVTGVYTNKAPGGVAYACSFRVTEAVYLVERMVDVLARKLEMDPAELRLKNFIQPEQFPYANKTGWEYDSGNYEPAMRLSMQMAGYDELRREQAGEARARRADGHRRLLLHRDRRRRPAQALRHRRPRHGRRRRTARPPHRQGRRPALGAEPGPGPRDHLRADRRRGTRHPAGGHRRRARRHRPDAVRPGHLRQPVDAGQRRRGRPGRPQGAGEGEADRRGHARDPARGPGMGEGPLVRQGRPRRRARPSPRSPWRAHGTVALPEGVDGNLDAEVTYDPPNLTFPFGAYICVVDVDPGTGTVKVRRFIAVTTAAPGSTR